MYKTTIVITIGQRKGGVGKSTSVLNLACALSALGYRVLIADLDDQQNATNSITSHPAGDLTVADLLLQDDIDANQVKQATSWPNVWMLPASGNLSGVAKHLDSEVGGHLVLAEKLQAATDMDFILIDTSPSLNILVINALCASNYLFIPLSSKYFSLQGLGKTLGAFNKVKQRLNPDLCLLGLAFVIHDKRNTLACEIVEKVRSQYPSLLFETIVGVNIRIEEAQVKKESVMSYAPGDRGAKQYRALAGEILIRTGSLQTGAAHE